MANKYVNIEEIGKILSGGKLTELGKKVSATERSVQEILKKLSDLDNAQIAKKLEEEQRLAQEKKAAEEQLKREEAELAEKKKEEEEKKAAAPAPEQPAPAAVEEKEQKPEKEVKQDRQEKNEKPVRQEKSAKPAGTSASAPVKAEKQAKPAAKTPERQAKPANTGKTFVNSDGGKPRGERSARPQGAQVRTPQPSRPQVGAKPAASAAQAKPAAKNFGPDKKKGGYERTYVEKERRAPSKRSLAKQQGPSVSDFDEDKSGYRKLRVKKDKKQQSAQTIKIDHAVVTTSEIPLKVLSEKLGITAVEITKRLFKEGIMKTVNESIDYDTAALLAAGMGIELEYKPEKTAEEILSEKQADTVEEIESLVPRAPVVTVMGHVDHGKTSLLDYIRRQNVAAGEAGGITQHIGAYSVTVSGKSITFIDTPGHEAFTAMRARGAQVTDIVILVVAADDGIMPQTVEAINHAKAANVSIIVAINKIDKAGANPDKVKQELMKYDLVPEEWGGDIPVCLISCKTGQGIDELLENILIVAEMKELLANPAREARGTVIEAQLDKGKGPVATVLIQNGTLHTGDNIISGLITGRVRAMIDDKGRTVKEAGPSSAVYVLGFEQVPNAGDSIFAVSQELMKSVIEERKRKESDAMVKAASKISLDDVFGKIAEGNMKTLNLIVKGDVQGSVEAVKQSVVKLSNEEVQVKVIHSGAGAINESDVMLADSSNAIILGFNVRPDAKAKATAERSKVDIRLYRIIYDLLDDVEASLKGMLAPKYQEVYLGKCEVRQTFKITGVGTVAGCYVKEGKLVRGGKLRIYRDDVLIVEGNVQQLKRFKDDVKEVNYGYECGCAIEGFNDIRVGDIIECYMIEQIPNK
ncbi:MAG TPA: translation initiation factor IF-2 [Candidatus Coproplasma avicola]|uniref:Translation initiation factor IF-2 n=1 Tax=Candidatus Coproplasma avicola TaxID=2840744 RepID=A0A9D1E701_9FIRM|nr:translation initiation factor IF-2 [Candidatus Coproplasma avicola]